MTGWGSAWTSATPSARGEWPRETVRLLAPHAINLHLKDFDIIPDRYGVGFIVEGVPFGTGRTESEAVLAALDGRPDMSMLYEHWMPWPGDCRRRRHGGTGLGRARPGAVRGPRRRGVNRRPPRSGPRRAKGMASRGSTPGSAGLGAVAP